MPRIAVWLIAAGVVLLLEFDYVIIGAGSAGCVLANRLSESSTVALIEAGPVDYLWDFRIHMPAALSKVLTGGHYNWNYETEPEPSLDDRRLYCPRGRVLGGSSSINGMIFVRGNPGDYNRWADNYGLQDWRYENCLEFFRKSETVHFDGSLHRGGMGPLQLSRGDLSNPLFHAWITGAMEAGFPVTDDFNGGSQEGAGPFDQSIYEGRRQSCARAYLRPVIDRSNLTVMTGTQVSKINFSGKRATGVSCFRDREEFCVAAGKEVILSGGAINSPQLLMLSGIGDARHLQAQGIACLIDRPEVGSNLQDHLEVYIQYACSKPVSIYHSTRWYRQLFVGLQWYLSHQGDGATNHFEAGAFLKSGDDVDFPDLQFHFLPVAMDYDGKDQYRGHGFQAHVGPMKPESRGTVQLRSGDSQDSPIIRFNYNESLRDREVMRRGIRIARHIIKQPAFSQYRGDELRPGPESESDEELDSFIRKYAESAYHPSSTCRMGTDRKAVVNQGGQVIGVSGLRVADASIMPEIINGNLNAAVVMMAEKISDMIMRKN